MALLPLTPSNRATKCGVILRMSLGARFQNPARVRARRGTMGMLSTLLLFFGGYIGARRESTSPRRREISSEANASASLAFLPSAHNRSVCWATISAQSASRARLRPINSVCIRWRSMMESSASNRFSKKKETASTGAGRAVFDPRGKRPVAISLDSNSRTRTSKIEFFATHSGSRAETHTWE